MGAEADAADCFRFVHGLPRGIWAHVIVQRNEDGDGPAAGYKFTSAGGDAGGVDPLFQAVKGFYFATPP